MERNDVGFLVAAMLFHLALPVMAAVAPKPSFAIVDRQEEPLAMEVEIDVDTEPLVIPAPLPNDVTDGDPDSAPKPARPRAGMRAPRPGSTARSGGAADILVGEGIAEPGQGVPTPAGEGGDDDFNTAPGADDVPGWNPGAWPVGEGDRPGSNPAPTSIPRRKRDGAGAQKALADAMRAKDKGKGLDFPAGGAIARVIKLAVRASDAPHDCSGNFSITMSAGGKVTSVSLVSFSGGGAGVWQGIRSSVKGQLGGRTFRMSSHYPKGAMLGVAVRSARKAAGGGTGRDGLTLKFDVADIAAKPVRVVTAGWSARPVE